MNILAQASNEGVSLVNTFIQALNGDLSAIITSAIVIGVIVLGAVMAWRIAKKFASGGYDS